MINKNKAAKDVSGVVGLLLVACCFENSESKTGVVQGVVQPGNDAQPREVM